MARLRKDVLPAEPRPRDVYDELYAEYLRLHDYFGRGGNERDEGLKAIRARTRSETVPA